MGLGKPYGCMLALLVLWLARSIVCPVFLQSYWMQHWHVVDDKGHVTRSEVC